MMLDQSKSEADDDSDTTIDDSDGDPDFVMPVEDRQYSESENDDELLQGESNIVVVQDHVNTLDDQHYNALNGEDDSMEEHPEAEPEFYIGKPEQQKKICGFKWASKEPPVNVRTSAHNLVKGDLPGLRGEARQP